MGKGVGAGGGGEGASANEGTCLWVVSPQYNVQTHPKPV